jgi:hypothetical protein
MTFEDGLWTALRGEPARAEEGRQGADGHLVTPNGVAIAEAPSRPLACHSEEHQTEPALRVVIEPATVTRFVRER